MSYVWYDGAKADQTVHLKDVHDRDEDDADITTHSYNSYGQLTKAKIEDGQERTVTYTNDLSGQVLRRKVSVTDDSGANAPTEVWYRFGGSCNSALRNEALASHEQIWAHYHLQSGG